MSIISQLKKKEDAELGKKLFTLMKSNLPVSFLAHAFGVFSSIPWTQRSIAMFLLRFL